MIGALAVVFSGYLAAVYLAADSLRHGKSRMRSRERMRVRLRVRVRGRCGTLADAFRRRALAAGLVCGALALAGLLVMRSSGLNLTHGAALALVCVSAAAGPGHAAAVLAVPVRAGPGDGGAGGGGGRGGLGGGQAPRFLPGLTVVQAAAGRSTLVALVIAVVRAARWCWCRRWRCCSRCTCAGGWTPGLRSERR